MNENIQAEIKKVLDIKLRPRIDAEVKDLLHARKESEKINEQVRNIEARVEAARDAQHKLDVEVEKQILQGNAPNAQIRDAALKKAEIETYTNQIEKLAKAGREADRKVQEAEKALSAALWRELPECRNEIEETVRARILEGLKYMKRWREMFREVYSEYGVRPDRKAETRLSLFYGLQDLIRDDIPEFIDPSIDPLFAQAKRKSMGMRG
jgi:chromosome segregation ATPase